MTRNIISTDVRYDGYDEDELRPLSIGKKDYLVQASHWYDLIMGITTQIPEAYRKIGKVKRAVSSPSELELVSAAVCRIERAKNRRALEMAGHNF